MRKYLSLALLLLTLAMATKQLFSEMQKVHLLRQELAATQAANQELKQGYEQQLATMQAALNTRERDAARLAQQNAKMQGVLYDIQSSNPNWGSTPVPSDVVKRVCLVVKCSNEHS